ncbi:MAG TPA: hypothetical protein VES95_14015 [Dermatophilaceae bacterium]|nr:hypothetical protein [Dermatophilaceae bacterium]
MGGLVTAATSGGGDLASRPQPQVAEIRLSANDQVQIVRMPPEEWRNEPEVAAVRSSADELASSVDGVEASLTTLKAASGVAGKARAAKDVVSAAQESRSAAAATSEAVQTARQSKNGVVSTAFSSSPSCAALES